MLKNGFHNEDTMDEIKYCLDDIKQVINFLPDKPAAQIGHRLYQVISVRYQAALSLYLDITLASLVHHISV